jgi:hypothetical protein
VPVLSGAGFDELFYVLALGIIPADEDLQWHDVCAIDENISCRHRDGPINFRHHAIHWNRVIATLFHDAVEDPSMSEYYGQAFRRAERRAGRERLAYWLEGSNSLEDWVTQLFDLAISNVASDLSGAEQWEWDHTADLTSRHGLWWMPVPAIMGDERYRDKNGGMLELRQVNR